MREQGPDRMQYMASFLERHYQIKGAEYRSENSLLLS